jgi:hypothetical protein
MRANPDRGGDGFEASSWMSDVMSVDGDFGVEPALFRARAHARSDKP